MQLEWSKFGQHPISPQLQEFSMKNLNFQKAWKFFESDKFLTLPTFLLFSGGEIKDEVIVNFFLSIKEYKKGKEDFIHTNVIVNKNFQHKEYIIYTGLPDHLRYLWKDQYVNSKKVLCKEYPWIRQFVMLDRISPENLPDNPHIKIALKRTFENLID